MKTPITIITNVYGRQFAVRYLPTGANYGRTGSVVADKDMVEFYDTTYADDTDSLRGFGPIGQFVSRYYIDTLLGENSHGIGLGGLRLHSDDNWIIDAVAMVEVRIWIRQTREKLALGT